MKLDKKNIEDKRPELLEQFKEVSPFIVSINQDQRRLKILFEVDGINDEMAIGENGTVKNFDWATDNGFDANFVKDRIFSNLRLLFAINRSKEEAYLYCVMPRDLNFEENRMVRERTRDACKKFCDK